MDDPGGIPPPRSAASPLSTGQSSEINHAELRQRRTVLKNASVDGEETQQAQGEKVKEETTWGRTPAGAVFRVPQTSSFVTTLLSTLHRSSLTRYTFLSLIAQPILFYYLRNHSTIRSTFFLLYFIFWRGAYDFGFAWVLRQQSERRWVVRLLRQWGWLQGSGSSIGQAEKGNGDGDGDGAEWARWWKRELEMKMGEGYKWEDVPAEFNSWLMFRQLVDIVLLNDFVSYTCFAWSNLHFPPNHSVLLHVARWVGGWSLILFNLWVKMDAHRVVKDYAWYWGDAFWLMVMQNDLVFDGVYEIAPHPMYSVGYAGYYGLSMVVGSYAVLFVSLAAHAAQFAFLLWFENPHIERTYGGAKKPLAARVPLDWSEAVGGSEIPGSPSHQSDNQFESPSRAVEVEAGTPGITEGETETEPELSDLPNDDTPTTDIRKPRSDSSYSVLSLSPDEITALPKGEPRPQRRRAKTISMHDLNNRFFRKPVIVLSRLDVFRAPDFALVVLFMYALTTLVPALPPRLALTAHFLHALSWRLFHSYGLGLLLRAQSKSKWLVRHYLKHYHYPGSGNVEHNSGRVGEAVEERESVVKRATEEAFGNWQVGYNISLVMTYVSFAGLAWKTYHLPSDWTVSGIILRHVLGTLLIALHVWAASSTYEALGDFGWLYSDFFLIEQIPSRLAYTGIYRFLNNPERSMGGAAFLGLWLISWSKLVLVLAVVSHLSHWWFLTFVETPHMKRLYGDRLRKDGGLTKTLKSVAGKTLGAKADKHAPGIQRMVKEVRGSIEKVEGRVTEAVEEFLDHARPIFSEMVNDTKVLLQQSRERMSITRVARDISAYDPSRYSIHLATTSSASPTPRYHVGQPIRVSWTAPANHSRKDWIGLYRLGSCKSQLVTRISSTGKWMPIHEEEYDGDEQVTPSSEAHAEKKDAGTAVFRGNQLPWMPGMYEMRYHHDGKHNVMSRIAPIEIYVNKPADGSYRAVHDALVDIVTLSLGSDPKLVPHSAKRRMSSIIRPDLGEGEGDATPRCAVISPGAERFDDHVPSMQGSRHLKDPGHSLSSIKDADDTAPSAGVLQQSAKSAIAASPDSLDHADPLDPPSPPPEGDPDDFVIMDEQQAKRIVSLCEQVFGVDLSVDVVVADANVGALVQRIIGARSLIESGGG